MAQHQLLYKKPGADLRLKYQRILEGSLIVTLTLLIVLLYSFKNFDTSVKIQRTIDATIRTVDIPQTLQNTPPPPQPERPRIPVASDEENLPEEIPIEKIDKIFHPPDSILPQPPEVEEPTVNFVELSEFPRELVRVNPKYPEMAKKAGIQGIVVVQVLIDTKGNVEDVRIFKSHPMFDEAAIAAAKQFKFTPAKQRDRLVKVWMSIPFHFRLKH